MVSKETLLHELEPVLCSFFDGTLPEPGKTVGIIDHTWFSAFIDYITHDNVAFPGPIPSLDLDHASDFKIQRNIDVIELNVVEILQSFYGGSLIEKRLFVLNPITGEPEVLFNPIRIDIIFKSTRKGLTTSLHWTVGMLKMYFCNSMGVDPTHYLVKNANTFNSIDEQMTIKEMTASKIFTIHVLSVNDNKRRLQVEPNNESTDLYSTIFSAFLVALSNLDIIKTCFRDLKPADECSIAYLFCQYLSNPEARSIVTQQIISAYCVKYRNNNHNMKVEEFEQFVKFFLKELNDSFPRNGPFPKLDFTKNCREMWDECVSIIPAQIFSNFYGLMKGVKKCPKCGKEKGSVIPFCIVQLPITKKMLHKITVKQCLKSFLSESDFDFLQKCEKCDGKLKHAKTDAKFIKMPEVLILHLNRFVRNNKGLTKDMTNVYYDNELDFSSICEEDSNVKYKLTSVIIHPGGPPCSRHRAICYNSNDKHWLSYSRIVGSVVPSSNAMNYQNAHTLIYEKQHVSK